MRCQPMLYVADVQASSRWYRELLAAGHDHDGPDFDRILIGDEALLMLHARGAHEHGDGGVAETAGSGIQLWFVVDNVDAVHERAVRMQATQLTDAAFNPLAHWREFTLVDPDGYVVAVAG